MTEDIVLIIDDNPNNLRILGSTLVTDHYKIIIAKNGKSGLKHLQKYKPSIVLLDIMMPDMDGYQVIKEIKSLRDYKEIPVIFISAKETPEDIVKGFEMGAVDYITKPFNKKELLARVKNHIDLYKARIMIEEQAIQLRASNETKNMLFSILGHDMRIPLATINLILDKLLESDICKNLENTKDALLLIKDSAFQTKILFDNLLNWGKGQLGKLNSNPIKFDIVGITRDIKSLVLPASEQKNLKVNITHEGSLFVFADKNMIELVIRNLLVNALKFSFNGGEVNIEFQKNIDNLKVSIKDEGIGITDDLMKDLFNKDKIVSNIGTDGEKGAGIGLQICKSFIELNQGQLWVEKNIAKGSVFSFTLPIAT